MIYLNDINNIGLRRQIYMYAGDLRVVYRHNQDTYLEWLANSDSNLIADCARLHTSVLNPSKIKIARLKHQQKREIIIALSN